MRQKTLVLVLTVALGGVASAQPGPSPGPPPPMDTTMPTDPAPPDPTPQPPPPPPPQPQPQQPAAAPEEVGDRPEGISLALGIGYGLPTSLETPNLTSARVRLPSGLQFEPVLRISNTTITRETAAGEAEDKETRFALSALVRIPLVTKSKVDLELLGTAGFSNQKTNPELDFNTQTVNTFGIGYGVAVTYWLSRHWNFSLSTTNPLISYEQTKVQTGPGTSNKNSATTVGLIFVPQVFMMIHLYN